MPFMRRVIIDCDPGVDDATALFLAFAARDKLDVLGVTTVAGNVGLELTTRNACLVREMARREDVPVFSGASRPLVRPPVDAGDFHGATGLGPLPVFAPRKSREIGAAAAFIAETLLHREAHTVTLVVTGPCTNVAAAIQARPAIADRIAEIVVMGGARAEGGNITASAEYNFYADPHAAQIVLSCGAPVTLFGLDVTHKVRTSPARIAAFRAADTAVTRAVADLFAFSSRLEPGSPDDPGAPLHDPCTVAYLLDPAFFAFRPCYAAVETEGAIAMGHSQIEFRRRGDVDFAARWAVSANAQAIFDLILERTRRL
jgi:purine nucleosidase